MEVRAQSHVVFKLLYHIVWIPKYRRKVLVRGVAAYAEDAIKTVVVEEYPDVILEEISVQQDHVHIVISIPPKYAISSVVGTIKRISSKKLRQKFEYLNKPRIGMWSIGYFVSSVGLDEGKIRKYVKFQQKQDEGQPVRL